MTKVSPHISTTEVFKLEPLRTYVALINARKSFQEPSSPLINMLESDISLKRVNGWLYKKFAFLRIRQIFIEHLYLSDVQSFIIIEKFEFVYVLMHYLQFLRSHRQSRFVDGTADVVDQSGIFRRLAYPEVDEIFRSLAVLWLKDDREDGIVLELVLHSTTMDFQIQVTIICVSRHLNWNCIQHHVYYFFSDQVIASNEADAYLRYFDYVLVGIFSLLIILLNLQLQFFYVVLEPKNQF